MNQAFASWILVGLLGAPALAQPKLFSVQPGESKVSFHIIHKLHEVTGVTTKPDGKARLLPDGTLQVQVMAPVADFDSGNSNRDAHVKEVTEAAKFPTADFKGVGSRVVLPTRFPGDLTVQLKGQLTFHGVTRPMEVPVQVHFLDAQHATAEGSFTISLDSFHVERPSLLFVKVDDAAKLSFHLRLESA